jgi:sulfide dehydrogenase [flavocytochrome c] flavoprotein chain
MQRRSFITSSAALGLLGLAGCASTASVPAKARVVVIGGGWGGATAAKYVRLLSDHKIDTVLVEPNAAFVSCPVSNLVLGGSKQLADLTTPYTGLARNHGVTVVRDIATRIDTARKTVTLAGGATIGYDKLILSPGIDLRLDSIEGLAAAHASGQVLHAWKAGPRDRGAAQAAGGHA